MSKIAPLLLLLAMLASCSMRTSAIAGTWTLSGEHPAEVPDAVWVSIGQDSAHITTITGHEVQVVNYYIDSKGYLRPIGASPNLWVIERQGRYLTLTDRMDNVAVYSRQ